MKISKRGQATIALKATNLPTAMSASSIRKNPHQTPKSPKSACESLPLESENNKELISDGESTQFQFSNQGRSAISAGRALTNNNKSELPAFSDAITAVTSGQGGGPDDPSHSYSVFSSKLVKFRDTKLRAIKFTQSGSRGKLLITFD